MQDVCFSERVRASIRSRSDTIGFHESALNAAPNDVRSGRRAIVSGLNTASARLLAWQRVVAFVAATGSTAEGGDCCVELEARIAELQETTARNGKSKSQPGDLRLGERGAASIWDDGVERNAYIGTDFVEQSRFKFVGEARDRLRNGARATSSRTAVARAIPRTRCDQDNIASQHSSSANRRIRAQPAQEQLVSQEQSPRPSCGRPERHGHLSRLAR